MGVGHAAATFALSVTAPDRYDRYVPRGPYATKLGDAAGHARAVARNSAGAAWDAWAAVADAFTDLHAAAAAAPKQPLVKAWIDSLAARRAAGLARDSATAQSMCRPAVSVASKRMVAPFVR